jgi:menaquinol-cytochrome c reductase iron-sulfur subunit
MVMGEIDVKKGLDRRSFLRRTINAMIGGATALLGVPVISYIISPVLKRPGFVWTEVGSVGDFKTGSPNKVAYRALSQDAWSRRFVERSAWVVAKGEKSYTVFSPFCTHLGCLYNWIEDRGRFECPCHNSIFDIEGRVISGPAPRSLDRYEAKVDDRKLFVGALKKGEA